MHRFHTSNEIRLSELIGALSHALDMTEGQPPGHCVRCCWIGMQLASKLTLSDTQLHDLYYTLLLKDLGCSSNAARICQLYMTDDLNFKREFKEVDSFGSVITFILKHTGLQAGLTDRFKQVFTIFQNGDAYAQELIQTRCQRGAEIARQLRFSDIVADGILSLDEHWNGKGRPQQLAGEAIPLFSRIALMAQVIDVFFCVGGKVGAVHEVQQRRGRWFDPILVEHFLQIAKNENFWEQLSAPDLSEVVFSMSAAQADRELDDDYLDEIAAAFGQVVDAKSPYTAGHSGRVALYTELLAEELGIEPNQRRWLKRGALLHDVGKLGVSNMVLDKPGKLDETEWLAVQKHAQFTEEILGRISAFRELSFVAGAHHERLDGKGYPRGLMASDIPQETRIITTADIFDAITAERPYRGAIPIPKTLEIMAEAVGTAIDADCFAALNRVVSRL